MFVNPPSGGKSTEEIIRIRLEFLKRKKETLKKASTLIAASILMQVPTDLIPVQPLEATPADAFIAAFLLVLTIVSSALLAVGATMLGAFAHSALKIKYLSLLDMMRLLTFFAAILAGFSMIAWTFAGSMSLSKEVAVEVLEAALFWAYYTDRMTSTVMSFSFFLLTVMLISNRKILRNILKIRRVNMVYIFLILNFLALMFNLLPILIGLILVLPTVVFIAFNPKLAYMYAYTDMKRYIG